MLRKLSRSHEACLVEWHVNYSKGKHGNAIEYILPVRFYDVFDELSDLERYFDRHKKR